MAKVHGKSAFLKINSTTVSGQGRSITHNYSLASADVTSFGDTADNFLPGNESGTLSMSGFFDSTTHAAISALVAGTVTTTSTYEYGPSGAVTGGVKISGSCFVTAYNVSSPVDGGVTAELTIQRSGAVTNSTY